MCIFYVLIGIFGIFLLSFIIIVLLNQRLCCKNRLLYINILIFIVYIYYVIFWHFFCYHKLSFNDNKKMPILIPIKNIKNIITKNKYYRFVCDCNFYLSRQKISSVRVFSISQKWTFIFVHFFQKKILFIFSFE